MKPTFDVTTSVTDDTVASYQDRGFVHVPGILDQAEVERFRAAVERFRAHHGTLRGKDSKIFAQYVDVWRSDPTLAELTRHPRLAAVAERLAGIPLRLWHDQILVKEPHNGAATEFHQDAQYWPHGRCRHALTAWVALVDVPAERGAMTFIPGSQRETGLEWQSLSDSTSMLRIWPEGQWRERVTLPLRAGDCTFHHFYTAHTANANDSDDPRIAQIVVYIDAETTYDGRYHPVTDGLGLAEGQPLPDEHFPRMT